jgi:PRTRC genetic system protein B
VEDLLRWMAGRREASAPFLPPNVLSVSNRLLVWTMRGGVRPMWFANGGKPFKMDVPWPHLVVGACGRKLHVAALGGLRRPSPKTRLFHAPLMNVFDTGAVCVGNASLPESCGVDSMPGWESVLKDTGFSHVNHLRTLRTTEKQGVDNKAHLDFWRGLAKAKAASFPRERLAPLGGDLGRFIERVAHGQ